VITRTLRSSLLEVLAEDYVRNGARQGLSEVGEDHGPDQGE